jgi:phosphatidylglycerol lysyltransferase
MKKIRLRIAAYYAPIFLTVLLGLLDIASADGSRLNRPMFLVAVFGRSVSLASRGLVLVIGFFLLLLSQGLLRRSRTAWQVGVILTVLSALGHLFKGIDYDGAAFSLVVLAALLASSPFYRRPNDRPTVRRGLMTLATSASALLVFGILSFHFLGARNFGQRFGVSESLVHMARLYFFFGDPTLVPHTLFARLFLSLVYAIAAFSWAIVALALILPALERFQREPAEQTLAQGLVEQFGDSSLDYFKVYWDKQYFFSSDRLGFLAYKLVEPTAIVLGDPVGEPATVRRTIREFRRYSAERGWRLVFQQVTDRYVRTYAEEGFHKLKIGEEAVVSLGQLSLEGREMKDLRTTLRRMERDGFFVKQYAPPLTSGLVQRLQQVSQEWLQLPSRSERIFAQSMFDPSLTKLCPVATVEDGEGEIFAFISLLPDYAPYCVTLDLLRRRAKIPNGIVDALVYETGVAWRERGYEKFALGLAPLSGLGEGEKISLPEKTLKLFYDNLNAVFSYKGLREFKAKFNPVWEPRYMIYQHVYQLPALGLAVLRASQVKRWSAQRAGFKVPVALPERFPVR